MENLDFIQGRKTRLWRDPLNFIKKKVKSKEKNLIKSDIFRDKSYLLRPSESPLEIKNKIQAQSSRYNIYEQCLFQLKKGKGEIKHKLKEYKN